MFTQITGPTNKMERLTRFASIAELADHCEELPRAAFHKNSSSSFAGGTWSEAMEQARTGCPQYVECASALVDQITTALNQDGDRIRWKLSAHGARPSVPATLAGLPLTMWRKQPTADETQPLRIFVNSSSAASVSAEQLIERGAAVLAMAMKLAAERPVELYAITTLGGAGIYHADITCTAIGTNPIDIQAASFALASPLFLRRLTFAHWYAWAKDEKIPWAWDVYPQHDIAKHRSKVRAFLKLAPNEIYIDPAHGEDPRSWTDPVGWANDLIDRVKENQPEEVE